MPKIYSAGDSLPATDLNGIVKVAGGYAASSTGNDSYVITVTPTPGSLVAGDVFYFKADVANTGAATLNVNSLGAKTIKKNVDVDLADGDIKAGQLVKVIYDGTNFQMLDVASNKNPSHNVTIKADHTNHDVDGTTAETDMIAQFTINGGIVGANDMIEIEATWDIKEVASGDTKTFKIYVGGSVIHATSLAFNSGSLDNQMKITLRNRNSVSSQLLTEELIRATTLTTKVYDSTASINFASNVNIKVTGQTTSAIAGRGLVLRSFIVKHIKSE